MSEAFGVVGRNDSHHLELANHSGAVKGVPRADAGYDRVQMSKRRAVAENRRRAGGDVASFGVVWRPILVVRKKDLRLAWRLFLAQ